VAQQDLKTLKGKYFTTTPSIISSNHIKLPSPFHEKPFQKCF
jgi:hypothetical protein